MSTNGIEPKTKCSVCVLGKPVTWEEASKQNSSSFEEFLATRKLLVDIGKYALVNPRTTEEGMPVLGSYEFNLII